MPQYNNQNKFGSKESKQQQTDGMHAEEKVQESDNDDR